MDTTRNQGRGVAKRLVLHGGLPKTATSSLQSWFNSQATLLRQHGIYWGVPSAVEHSPKHQWLVEELISGSFARLKEALSHSEVDTLLLSTEGLTNHMLDFPESSLEAFRNMTKEVDVSFVVVVREPRAWARSYWKQALINPRSADGYYGSGEPFESYCKKPRVQFLTDHAQVVERAHQAFGCEDVFVARMEDDPFARIFRYLGFSDDTARRVAPTVERENISMSDDVTEVVRQINSFEAPEEVRRIALIALAKGQATASNLSIMSKSPLFKSGCSANLSTVQLLLNSVRSNSESQRALVSAARYEVNRTSGLFGDWVSQQGA